MLWLEAGGGSGGWAQGRTCRDEGVQVGTWDDILSCEW